MINFQKVIMWAYIITNQLLHFPYLYCLVPFIELHITCKKLASTSIFLEFVAFTIPFVAVLK